MARAGRLRRSDPDADRGAVDVSIEMLFGMVSVLLTVLLVVEVTAYWHARNVYDDAAAEGARVAAAFDGTCEDGIAVATAAIRRQVGGWTDDLDIRCTDGEVVTVSVRGRTAGFVSQSLGTEAHVEESAPRER